MSITLCDCGYRASMTANGVSVCGVCAGMTSNEITLSETHRDPVGGRVYVSGSVVTGEVAANLFPLDSGSNELGL